MMPIVYIFIEASSEGGSNSTIYYPEQPKDDAEAAVNIPNTISTDKDVAVNNKTELHHDRKYLENSPVLFL